MSNKIKQSLAKKPNKHELSNYQFDMLNSIDRFRMSFDHYAQQLESQYLKVLATEQFGYDPADDLEFNIDLKSESHELTVKVLPKKK
jgi:hypothetical protein